MYRTVADVADGTVTGGRMTVDPLAAGRADAKIRVYELLKKARASRKDENKEQYRGHAEAIIQEWHLTRQEFGE